MADKINVNFRADRAKIAALDAIAKAQDRDRSYIINEVLENYISHRKWMNEEIRKAVAEADAGHFLSDEEVAEMYREWDAE